MALDPKKAARCAPGNGARQRSHCVSHIRKINLSRIVCERLIWRRRLSSQNALLRHLLVMREEVRLSARGWDKSQPSVLRYPSSC
jgi:hypothetical protein